ncbi:MAG TPA: glutamate--cysteine ligase [Acidimicrobiales bacterium]|nr:glutamate--cysteine ligase [Acidimicrobiales bacterium]
MAGALTVGVEEEFCIVDAGTGAVRPAVDEVLPVAKERLGDQVEAELNRSQVETATAVCTTLAEVRAELERLRRLLREAAAEVGCGVVSSGTHPTADPGDSEVNPAKERYRWLEREFQAVAREQLVNGCHVHVGIADRDLAIQVLDRSRPWLYTVAALAADSPFWTGADTGYASYRAEVWTRWPLTGMPEPLGSRARFDELVTALREVDALPDPTFLYWDVRPSARFETLEFRAGDGCLTVDDAVMVAGLWRALARTLIDEVERGYPPPAVRGELVAAARWRAARYGAEGTLVDLGALRTAPAREVVDGLLDHLRPALEEEGDWDEVHTLVERVMAGGGGAARQRAALARRGRMEDVMALLLA